MKNEQIQDYVVITDLLPFMNKKFFNYVIYYLPKTISVSSHEVYYKDKLPFACMINFEDKESKDLFVNKFSNESYPNLSM